MSQPTTSQPLKQFWSALNWFEHRNIFRQSRVQGRNTLPRLPQQDSRHALSPIRRGLLQPARRRMELPPRPPVGSGRHGRNGSTVRGERQRKNWSDSGGERPRKNHLRFPPQALPFLRRVHRQPLRTQIPRRLLPGNVAQISARPRRPMPIREMDRTPGIPRKPRGIASIPHKSLVPTRQRRRTLRHL